MSVEISAVFETPDMADFALMRLRNNQIPLDSFSIQPLKWRMKRASSQPLYSMTNSTWFANVLQPHVNVNPVNDRDAVMLEREVILTAAVAPQDVSRAIHILTNAHGQGVRKSER